MSEPAATVCPMTNEGDTSGSAQPHDALFRLVFTNPENTGSELRSVLPPELTAHIDLDGMVLQEGTFVDEHLRHRQTDVLFKTTVHGDDAYLYLLVEHQSSPDPLMAFRRLQYQVRIWDRHLKQHKIQPGQRPLPLIIPVVIYQGRRHWNAPTDIAYLLNIDDSLATAAGNLVPHAGFLLDDLTTVDDATLRARPLTTAARITFVYLTHAPGDPHATRWMPNWTDHIIELDVKSVEAHFQYLVTVSPTDIYDVARYAATVGPDTMEAAMNTADVLRAEGHAEGRVEARADMLIELLTAKFGKLDPRIRNRVEHATTEQISEWSTRLVLGNEALDQVFGA